MNEHTPGPWNWLDYPDGRKLLTGPNNAVIHCPGPGPQMGCTEADQALIAAAPDLLMACQRVLVAYDEAYHASRPSKAVWRGEDVDAMRAAVGKARVEPSLPLLREEN